MFPPLHLLAAMYEEPLGEKILPFVFWPLLIGLLALIFWTSRVRARKAREAASGAPRRGTKSAAAGTNTAAARPRIPETDPRYYRAHHRPIWATSPATFEPSPDSWLLGLTATMGICSGQPWDRLRLENRTDIEPMLREAWGVRSRAQLLSMLHWLLREGHRVAFELDVTTGVNTDPAMIAALARDARSEDQREYAWRLQQANANARGVQAVRFEAWDLARAAMLARAGFSVGWLTEEEAVDTLRLIGREAQSVYESWGAFGNDHTVARWFWGATSGFESRKDDAHDSSRLEALLDEKLGPWAHVPWETPLPASRLLIVDALVNEGLVTEVPMDASTPLAATLDEATAATLERRW